MTLKRVSLSYGTQGALHWARVESGTATLFYQRNTVTSTVWVTLDAPVPGNHLMLVRVSKWRWPRCEWLVAMRAIRVGRLTLRWYRRVTVT